MTTGNEDTPESDWMTRLLRPAVPACALLYLFAYARVAIARMNYPFALEWMEGGSVDCVERILADKPIYVPPSLEFTPFFYTPLYFYLSSLVAKLCGIGLFSLRLVSFLASLVAFFFIFLIVWRETGNGLAGLWSAGFFAASFHLCGAWFDLARVDSLAMAFILGALFFARFAASARGQIPAAVLASLAFLTKQTMLLPLLALGVHAFMKAKRSGIVFLVLAGALTCGTVLALNISSHGWFDYYVFHLPLILPLDRAGIAGFWIRDIMPHLPIALALGMITFVRAKPLKCSDARSFYGLVTVSMVASSWITRSHSGGYDNALIPAVAMIAILSGIGLSNLRSVIQPRSWEPWVHLACLGQLTILFYRPSMQIPTVEHRLAGYKIVKAIKLIEGDVLAPSHGYLARLAGKSGFSPAFALPVFQDVRGNPTQILMREIKQAIREQRFDALVLNDKGWFEDLFANEIEENYVRSERLLAPDEFWPITGNPTRPEYLYRPKSISVVARLDGV